MKLGSKGYSAWGDDWAKKGYVVIFQAHDDRGVVRLRQDPRNLKNRPLDIKLIIKTGSDLAKDNEDLKSKMNFGLIGVSGHSFGAGTTMVIGGASFDLPDHMGGFSDAAPGETFGDKDYTWGREP